MLVTPSAAPCPESLLSLFPMDLLGLGAVEVVAKACTGMAPRLHFIFNILHFYISLHVGILSPYGPSGSGGAEINCGRGCIFIDSLQKAGSAVLLQNNGMHPRAMAVDLVSL